MSAATALLESYEQWRRWAQAEGDAIQTGDWDRVAQCQEAILELQTRIPAVTQAAQAEWLQLGADRQSRGIECRRIVTALIAQETHNRALLADQHHNAQTQLGELDRCASNLRRVQRMYAPGSPPAWTSFS